MVRHPCMEETTVVYPASRRYGPGTAMPMAMMAGSASSSAPTLVWMAAMVCGMVSSLTVGRSSMDSAVPLRSKTPISTRLRANLTPMTWNRVGSRFRPMERRFSRPSMSPVSSMMPASMRRAVILVMAAGVSPRALAICAREQMPW